MSNSIVKNAVIVLGVKQGKSNFKTNLDPIIKERKKHAEVLKQVEERVKAVEKAEKQEAATATKAAKQQIKAIEEARRAQEDLAKVTTSSQRAILGATQQAGEGVLGIARAFVLLGISSEDNLAKVIQSLARVQAAFDIFRGVSNIVKSVITVTQTLAAIEAAETAVKAANTAATQVNTTAKLANVAASRAQISILGPLGATVAAGTALVALAVFAMRDQTNAIENNIIAQRKRAQELQRNRDLERLGTDIGTPESRANKARRKALEANRARRLLAGDTRAEIELSEAKAILADFPDVAALGTDVDSVAIATLRIAEAQKAVKEERERELQTQRAQLLVAQSLKEVERQRQLEQQNRVGDIQAAFGSFDEFDQTRLQIIARRRREGKSIGRDDTNLISGIPGLDQVARGIRIQRGKQIASEVLGGFDLTPAGQPADQAVGDVRAAFEPITDGIRDVADTLGIAVDGLVGQVKRLAQSVEDNEDNVAKSAN